MTDRSTRLLLVEDDENLRVVLSDNLEDEGFEVRAVAKGRDALVAVSEREFDIVVLDIMLPDIDGYAVCRELRAAGCAAGVLMLTARTLEDDLIRGFDAGADDYLAKPYRFRELLARVRALARRRGDPAGPTEGFAGIAIDRRARSIRGRDGRPIELTRREFDFLLYLVDHRGEALSRDTILDRVWGSDVVVDPRTIDNFVSSLKRKLGWTPDCGFNIRALRGVGYRFEVDREG
jgi:DNA-binding response OmpR family regulator